VDGGWEEEAEHSTARNRMQERWPQGKRRSNLWILSPLSTLTTGNRLTWRLVFALPAQSTPTLIGWPRACPSINMSHKNGETGMGRRSIPHIPPRLCAASHRFRNRNHDCLGPREYHSVVTNRCLGTCQVRCFSIHVAHLGASTLIMYCNVPTGGTAPPLQSRQVQISSKLRRAKGISPTCGFTASPKVGPGANIGTLQTEYPCAQDLSLVPLCQTPHPAGEGFGVIACPHNSRPTPGAESSDIAMCPIAPGTPPGRGGL
jgi:hypothetical protein